MKCETRFKRIRPLHIRIEEAAYAGMEKITQASNVRVLRAADNDEWVNVEYDWPDDAPFFETADDVMRPHGLELVKGWREKAQEQPLR